MYIFSLWLFSFCTLTFIYMHIQYALISKLLSVRIFNAENQLYNLTGEWKKSTANLSGTVIANKINFILTSFSRVWGVCRRWADLSASSYSVLLGKLYPTLRRGCPSRCNLHIATQLTPGTISHPDYARRGRDVDGSGECARHAMSAKARQNRQPSQKNPFDEGNGWGEKVCTAITHRSHLIYLVVPASPSRSFLRLYNSTKLNFNMNFFPN